MWSYKKATNPSDQYDIDLNIGDDELDDPLLLQELAALTMENEHTNNIKVEQIHVDDIHIDVTEADMNDPILLVYSISSNKG
jgi:hypothetical protein